MTDPIAQLLATALLALAFALPLQSRGPMALRLVAMQSVALALASCWQAWMREDWPPLLAAALVLALDWGLLPRFARGLPDALAAPRLPTRAFAVAILAVAILAVPSHLARADRVIAVAVALLGLLAMAARDGAVFQAAGLATLANGVLLAALAQSGLDVPPLDLSDPAALAIVIPLLAAGLLAPGRATLWINRAAAALTLLAALALPALSEAGGLLRVTATTALLATLIALIGCTTSCLANNASRRFCIAAQLGLAALLLAVLAADTALACLALVAAVAALAPTRKFLLLGLAGASLALLGALLLAPAPNLGGVFVLIGAALLAGLAPLQEALRDASAEATPPAALLLSTLPIPALFLLLRLRRLMVAGGGIDPGPILLALGLVSLLLAAASLWRTRDPARLLAASSLGQSGLVAFAFGLGSPAAIAAGLFLLVLHTLAKTAAIQALGLAPAGGFFPANRRLGLLLLAAALALAALPPFGLFAPTFLILAQTFQTLPLLALPLALGIVAAGWATIARLQALCFAPPAPEAKPVRAAALVVPALHLALAAAAGLAMPAALLAWLQPLLAAP